MHCKNCDCPFNLSKPDNGGIGADGHPCSLADAVQNVTFANGEVLFMQGQPSHSLYAITNGMVKICRHGPDGCEQIVGISTPKRLLVGLQSISDRRYAYTAMAATEVAACRINQQTLLERIRDFGELGFRLIDAYNAQLNHSRALIEVIGHRCAAAKIAAFILLLAPETSNGRCRFPLPFSRMEMAGILGLSEETVCRTMAGLKRDGAILAPRGNVEIRDRARLRQIARSDDHSSRRLAG